ncbi:hypothetical protein GLOIN_2v1778790 [Rhizophagus irregularis DAOM 181602=DAOM 197198]|uniref:Uncharacterized protein n=1 Tax=Rhizophagus irregularis (strain DAOM 181602 / DAOM 197198 / MUCL 43194) TaxID=747089 RepID=A0A2P4PRF1_RHIID|nr:hypothetical protein GLOIN_2v1778790 [Rhizophagus irregularis DAOM 181602=DAOM 197198]POG67975.1 hypothetical protein GLOIN_2v1778790 [Rhizophagus irregularis DAOM 181602=DAOM 197198]CAG8708837.1 17724_t:CDS:2 [Rhizophagus irregularis]|eukprot:XP_025174841.1 hypothetical protein GLOIN_2v1778790 [Rhizophagus irregularis DAOM 181602=DAOM 197198]
MNGACFELLAADDSNVRILAMLIVLILIYPTHGDVHPRVKFSAFEDKIEKTNAKNLVLNLTDLLAENTTGETDDIIEETRNFFQNLRNNTARAWHQKKLFRH